MIRWLHLRRWPSGVVRFACRDDRAAQLVEFAVSLPLLVVFVVGIFDFSGAFTLKQKLTNIARDAARTAAADPATDLAQPPESGVPSSVSDAFQLIDLYLIANKINDCGVSQSVFVTGPGQETWTFTGTSNGCPAGGLTIRINRGYYFPQNSATPPTETCASQTAGGQINIVATCVSIKYAYQWRFGRVASLLGASATLPSTISVTAVAMNEN